MATEQGDQMHLAIWLDGRETEQDVAKWLSDAPAVMHGWASRRGHKIGQVTFSTLRPGDRRCPVVPDHIQGHDVRLLVAEADVIGTVFVTRERPGFAHDLGPDDYAKLAMITRRKYRETYPDKPELTERQVETLINDLGPEAALDTLRDITPTDLI